MFLKYEVSSPSGQGQEACRPLAATSEGRRWKPSWLASPGPGRQRVRPTLLCFCALVQECVGHSMPRGHEKQAGRQGSIPGLDFKSSGCIDWMTMVSVYMFPSISALASPLWYLGGIAPLEQDACSRMPLLLLTPSKMLEIPTSIEVALTEDRPAFQFASGVYVILPSRISSKFTNLKKPSIFPSNSDRAIQLFKSARGRISRTKVKNVTDGASDIGHLDALDLGLFDKEAILYGTRQFRGILALTDGRRALCIWTEQHLSFYSLVSGF